MFWDDNSKKKQARTQNNHPCPRNNLIMGTRELRHTDL